MEQSGEEAEADGFVGKLTRRTRSGGRLWSAEIKGRAVFESMKPDARVCDVARRYGVKAQQLTRWRRLARAGRLALVTDDAADFVSIELSDPVASGKSEGPVEITIGKVSVRLDADVSAVRIAEIVTAIERGAHDHSGAGTADCACCASC
ncbi:transposase [Bradyrhizobium diazoefficiens]